MTADFFSSIGLSGFSVGLFFSGDSAVAISEYIANTVTPGVKVTQGSDDGTILMSFRPAAYNTQEGTDPPIGGFNFVMLPPRDFNGSGTRLDRPFAMGYNFGTAGGGTASGGDGDPAQLSTDATFGQTFEDFYNLAGTTKRQFEYYIASTPAGDDGSGQVRPFMIVTQYGTLASNTAPTSGVFFSIDESQGFTITMTHAGGTDTWEWGESTAGGLDTQCLVSAGAGIVFANNSRSLKAKLSSGTAKDIAYINSSDNLVIAEGGILAASVGALLKCDYGIQILYSTAASITDTTFTNNGSETPANGAMAITLNGGTSKLWIRTGGTWKSATFT